MTYCSFLLLASIAVSGCETVVVSLPDPLVIEIKLPDQSPDEILAQLRAIDATLSTARADFGDLLKWVGGSGGLLTLLGLGGGGGYMIVRKRAKKNDTDNG